MRAAALTVGMREIYPPDLNQYGLAIVHDPYDLDTLFQDSAGTTPVTGVEQPVGLMLDKGQGLELGPELVTNGTFDSDTTGWVPAANSAITNESQKLRVTATGGAYPNGATNIDVVAGRFYVISGNVSNLYIATSARIALGSSAGSGSYTGSPFVGGAISFIWLSSVTGTIYVSCRVENSAVGSRGDFDNISVREIKGYHFSQPTADSRPILRALWNMLVGSDSLATQNVTTLATDYTLSFSGTGTVTLSGTMTGVLSAGVSIITATAGTLTLTVAGTVTNAQLVATNISHPQGLEHGSELVVAGDFSDATKWALTSGVTISGGVLSATGDGVNYRTWIQDNDVIEEGALYLLTYTVVSNTLVGATGFSVHSSESNIRPTNGANTMICTVGTKSRYMRGVSTAYKDLYFVISPMSTSGTIVIDNISLVKITNAVSGYTFPYQSVTNSTTYDADPSKFPWYLEHTDHWMVTPAIDASTWDKVVVACALRKMSDTAIGVVLEFSTDSSAYSGTFAVFSPLNNQTYPYKGISFRSRGTSSSMSVNDSPLSPSSAAFIGISSISEDICKSYINGVAGHISGADQGTGNYGSSYEMYLGKRSASAYPFIGRYMGSVILFCGALPSQIILDSLSRYYAQKAGIRI